MVVDTAEVAGTELVAGVDAMALTGVELDTASDDDAEPDVVVVRESTPVVVLSGDTKLVATEVVKAAESELV